MTYYDELGLTQAARDEEIRRAHRTLSKLLHPDQQLDPAVRQAAEIQMRRLNGIVEVLLDPTLRSRYDESLKKVIEPPPEPDWRAKLLSRVQLNASAWGLIAIVATAVLLTVGAVWFYAGDLMHFGPTSGDVPQSPKKTVAMAEPERKRPASYASKRTSQIARREPPAFSEPVIVTAPVLAKPELETPPSLNIDSPATAPPVRPVLAPPEPSFSGLWVFSTSGQKGEQSKTPLYAPEFIELRLHSIESTLYGEYDSRYKVADRAISPHVRFAFHGARAPLSSFDWLSDDGSRGTVDLKLLTERSLQVNWRVTEFGSRLGLGAGTAVLTRTSDP